MVKKITWTDLTKRSGIYEVNRITKALAKKENLAPGLWEQVPFLQALGYRGLFLMFAPRAAGRIIEEAGHNRNEVSGGVMMLVKEIVNGKWIGSIVDTYFDLNLDLVDEYTQPDSFDLIFPCSEITFVPPDEFLERLFRAVPSECFAA